MVIEVNLKRIWNKIILKWRNIFILLFIAFMIFATFMMYSKGSTVVVNGKIDMSSLSIKKNSPVPLDGKWEFYWGELLISDDFKNDEALNINSLIKVPGSWNDIKSGDRNYPDKGIATYRIIIENISSIKDPALLMKGVTRAYNIYANGQLIETVGKVSAKPSDYEAGYKPVLLNLPNDKQIEIIIQVANLDYPRGGIRESPIFGSKQVIEKQQMIFLILQMLFIGSSFIFGIYYLILFLLQRKNKTALVFSILCFISVLRSLILGEAPIMIIFPNVTLKTMLLINYITAYNLVPIIILFVLSIYPEKFNKKILGLFLLPNLFFEAMLFTPVEFMSQFNNYLYILMFLQMIYIMGFLIKAVKCRFENSILMFISIGIFALTIIEDVLHHKGIGGINISYMFLYGNFAIIIVMSLIQARQQANSYKNLILYNEKLVEMDKLKDKIMGTEMSFLQAQIKPHFLYNALSAIANVCEKDSKTAGNLIIDLAIYLRGSLEFNHLDKMASIEKELEFINRYFNIEQARFGSKLQLIKDIEISLDYQIPVLILEPLVENAVRHGISKKIEGGSVCIKMKQEEEGIYIEIKDDGVGMNDEKLSTILNENRIGQGIGLLNINNRLIRLYGTGLDIQSQLGIGTCVKIFIPEERKHL